METLYLLIPFSVILVFFIGVAFWWSLRNGQFEDMEGPAYRILMDDDRARIDSEAAPSEQKQQATDENVGSCKVS